jgi:hypothetical protein
MTKAEVPIDSVILAFKKIKYFLALIKKNI